MGAPRGTIMAEELTVEILAAGAEIAAATTIEELQMVWRKRYPRIGHKALGRMFVAGGSNADVVAQRAAAAYLRMADKVK